MRLKRESHQCSAERADPYELRAFLGIDLELS